MEIPKYKIRSTYEVSKTKEFSVDWNGYNFLVIYGHHANGWFIAIPNWQICTEAGHPDDVLCNIEKLSEVIEIKNAANIISEAIKTHWSGMEIYFLQTLGLNDEKFKLTLRTALNSDIEQAIQAIKDSGNRNETRIAVCERELKRRKKRRNFNL